MGSRTLLALGLALCASVSGATYLGTRFLLDELREEGSGREAALRSLEARLDRKLAALERSDGSLDRRLRALAVARPAPVETRVEGVREAAAAEAEEPAEPTGSAPFPTFVTHPGAVIDDRSLLSATEQEFLDRYPPGEHAILVRGIEGRLGYLRISSKRNGRRTFTELDGNNFGLVEELSTAIIDTQTAVRAALTDLSAAGAGRECPSMEEAAQAGREIGGYYVLPVGERFRVFSSAEVERDRRVAMASAHLERVKEDFGDYTSYVVSWVQPVLEVPPPPSGPEQREGEQP